MPPDIPRAPREAMQWLLPMARPAAKSPPKPQVQPEPKARARITPAPKAITPPTADEILPPPPTSAPAPASIPDDPFAQAPAAQRPPSASDILSQAKLDVGKIDKQLRAAYPERAPVPPPDSKQARLERGIDAAHDAVPPKWYQAAKIIELNKRDGEDKTRTYKIVTAVITYCINVHPDGRRSYTNCPR